MAYIEQRLESLEQQLQRSMAIQQRTLELVSEMSAVMDTRMDRLATPTGKIEKDVVTLKTNMGEIKSILIEMNRRNRSWPTSRQLKGIALCF